MKLRVDIWLHRARIYKSRTQATEACKEGKIMIGEKFADAHDTVDVDAVIKIRMKGLYRTFLILESADINVSKAEAPRMYQEITDEATVEKFRQIQESNKLWRESGKREQGGRPTKKDRRDIDKARGR